MKDQELTVSKKHLRLRIAAFVFMFVVAIAAFGLAVMNLGRKEPGYYQIETDRDEALPYYQNGVTLMYAFTGSSSEIKTEMAEIKPAYVAALKKSYMLLDTQQTYPAYTNLASLNEAPGSEMRVSAELFDVLVDACAKTQEGQGFNVFAGPLYAEWNSLLILEDPLPFDPAFDPAERERIARLAEICGREGSAGLRVVDEATHTVCLEASDELLALLREYDLPQTILDLNVLHDAYRLRLVARELEALGYTSGYLCSDSGISISLSTHEAGEYCLYALEDGSALQAARITITAGSACSHFRAFSPQEKEYGYYSFADGAQTVYRHPYLSASGEYPQVLLSSCVVDDGGDAVEACYRNLRLAACTERGEVELLALDLAPSLVLYTLQGDGSKTVYTNGADDARVHTEGGYGYTVRSLAG